jgi:hypothetical protein
MKAYNNMDINIESDIDYIICQQCTFHNSLTAIECNMCGMTLEVTKKNISNNLKKINISEPIFASAAIAAQIPPTCIVESILRDDDDNNLPNIEGDAIVDFPIQCTVCTLDNHPGSKTCEACGTDLNNNYTNNYQRIAQINNNNNNNNNNNFNSNSNSKKKKSNNNSNIEYIPEAVVIPISNNGLNAYPIEAFPIDNNNSNNRR